MVKGLDIFRERFRAYEGSFVLIGGAACDEWFTQEGLTFRATKDLDIVLVIEVLETAFVAALRQFIVEGDYEIRQRSADGPPVLYRFAKPKDKRFPHMLELFSRKPDLIELGADQQIVPVPAGQDAHSLSAILVNDDYYALIQNHQMRNDGIPFASVTALIPLKAHAWLDLTSRREAGEDVDSDDIAKHRADVFRLAGTLPGEPGPELPQTILTDLAAFLNAFPEDSTEWPAILASVKNTLGTGLRPVVLRTAIQTYFRIS